MRRVYSELLPLGELRTHPVLPALAERDIQLLAAVRPGEEELARRLVGRARSLGLEIGLWPMLEDDHGRWLNPGNARRFESWIGALPLAEIDTLVLDLEPPISEVRAILDGRLGAVRAWIDRELDAEPHARIVRAVRAFDVEVMAAVVPFTLAPGRAGKGWQRALGTPIDDVDYDVVSSMLYTSLFEGYGLGVVRREDARSLLSRFAALGVARLGSRASVSLGAVGAGALGDEHIYRDPAELEDDVALALAAGIGDLALFDLGGVVARPPVERWLDAFVAPPEARPAAATKRAHALVAAAWLTGVVLSARWEPGRAR